MERDDDDINQPTGAPCPQCGRPLPPGAPEGLCPACLGAANFLGEATATATVAATLPGGGAPALPPPTCDEIAPHFPQLEVLECLGRGGMGVVYRARQRSLDRPVALKLLAPEREKDPAFAARFAREAQALARLNHPNIVTVHDFGESGGYYYLLMEFVDGVNLRQAMGAGKMTPEQALTVVPPVCDALEFAHRRGIVHRDIKPENLLMDRDGVVKIADFGIAKMLGNGAPPDEGAVGTPRYMAPEQGSDPARTDHRADIYSLGVVLYEMLTGELPSGDIVPPSRRVGVDVRLDEVVLRALDADPERRYQTAVDFGESVGRLSAATGATAAVTAGAAAPGAAVSRDAWWMPLVANLWWIAALVLAVGKVTARYSPDRYHLFGKGAWLTPEAYGTMVWGCILAGVAFLVWWARRGAGSLSPARGWLPFAGTFWAFVAVALVVGREAARYQPTRYQLFGAGAWFTPSGYAFLVALCLGVAIGGFAWWWWLGRPRSPVVTLGRQPAPAGPAGAPRLSRMAVVGFVWSGLFFLVALVSMVGFRVEVPEEGGSSVPTYWQLGLRFTLLPTGLAAPIGVTLLGWMSVNAIRRSGGRLYGMRLAVFDGLVFPLLAVNIATGFALWALSGAVLEMSVTPGVDELPTVMAFLLKNRLLLVPLATVVVSAVVDIVVYLVVLRRCRSGARSGRPAHL